MVKNTDGAPNFGHPLLQAGSQYNLAEEQGKGRSRGEASDRATELRRSRDRICRYAHGRSQQRRVGLSRLCVIGAYFISHVQRGQYATILTSLTFDLHRRFLCRFIFGP